MAFSSSVSDVLITLDGFGHLIFSQTEQGPGASDYDTVATCYDTLGRAVFTSLPYSAAAATSTTSCPNGAGTSTAYDALGRATSVSDSVGSVGYSYAKNDVYQTLSPAPSGENTKRKQSEYDALGWLTSVCEVTSASGSGTCSQTNGQTGYWTKYSYDALGDLTQVAQNAQGSPTQTRTYAYDMLGRLVSEINPETGTASYGYDTVPSPCYNFGDNQSGNLVAKTDANGNTSCYHDDAMHRLA